MYLHKHAKFRDVKIFFVFELDMRHCCKIQQCYIIGSFEPDPKLSPKDQVIQELQVSR